MGGEDSFLSLPTDERALAVGRDLRSGEMRPHLLSRLPGRSILQLLADGLLLLSSVALDTTNYAAGCSSCGSADSETLLLLGRLPYYVTKELLDLPGLSGFLLLACLELTNPPDHGRSLRMLGAQGVALLTALPVALLTARTVAGSESFDLALLLAPLAAHSGSTSSASQETRSR